MSVVTGYVLTFGKFALTISSDNKYQYYAPVEEVSPSVIDELHSLPIVVTFQIDKTRWSGETPLGPRYYATSVMLP